VIRLVFSLLAGLTLFVVLALFVWRGSTSTDRAAAHARVGTPEATTMPAVLAQPPVLASLPHAPDACEQFIAVMPIPPGLSRDMGQGLILAVALGQKETASIWAVAPPLRDTLWNLFMECIRIKGGTEPRINWFSTS
jgi:hypothetical protein